MTPLLGLRRTQLLDALLCMYSFYKQASYIVRAAMVTWSFSRALAGMCVRRKKEVDHQFVPSLEYERIHQK